MLSIAGQTAGPIGLKFFVITHGWPGGVPWDHVRSHTKSGPDQFSRFDVYWTQTKRQTPRQTS